MVEPNFSIYVKAPYLELDNYKAPKGIKSYFVCMDDGIKLEYATGKIIINYQKVQFYYNKDIMNLLKNTMKLFKNF